MQQQQPPPPTPAAVGTAPSLPPPQSLAEVEQLIQRLYEPGPGKLITQINAQLQQLQLGPEGWQMADALMGSEDQNVRFFAALTFTVKLNCDGPSLDEEMAGAVLGRLVGWLVRLVRQGEGGLVSKKLCATLTTFYVRAPTLWRSPLLHLALSMRHGDAVGEGYVRESGASMGDVLPLLSALQLQVLLWFAGTLADVVGRLDMNSQTHALLHKGMEVIVRDASAVIAFSVAQSAGPDAAAFRTEALRSFLTWVNYAQPVWPRAPEPLQYLRDLVRPAAECLLDQSLQEEALDIFRDILESYTSFFQPHHMELLASIIYNHIRPALLQALPEPEIDALPFGQLIIAFGCANIEQVIEEPSHQEGSAAIIQLHINILEAEGYPGDDDELSIQSIEFWNTYIEYVNDVLFSKGQDDPDPVWLSHSKNVTMQVFELLWRKMWTPPHETARDWGDSERESFKEFRLDASDLTLSLFVFLGKEMVHRLVSFTMQALQAGEWHAVEAALFCLNTLSDNVLEDASCEAAVNEVFRSSLFREIADFSQNVPTQCRRTAIDTLGSYSQYIEHHAEFLPSTLRFLFASLEAPGLANAAAKSIASLCSTCRNSLTGELPDFLAQYQRFLTLSTCDPYTKEKVVGAIAAIIQALTPESAKAGPLLALIKNVESDIEAAKMHAAAGDQDMTETMGVTALESLANIGKGLQVPDDLPIDLYEDDKVKASRPNFWQTEEGQAVQQRIMGCFSVLEVVGTSSTAIDAACQVLKSGFTESEPGPFVLPASVTVSFVQQCTLHTPQLEAVLATASMLITQHARATTPRIDDSVRALLHATLAFIDALSHPSHDPAVAMAALDLLNRTQPRYAAILFTSIRAPALDFALAALEGHDSFAKKAAAEFWAKLLKPQAEPLDNDMLAQVAAIVDMYGPRFACSLMRQLSGQALRSELDVLCEPLKVLLMQQRGAQAWLQGAIGGEGFAGDGGSVGEAQKAMFVRQLLGARSDGGRLKKVVREFWAACRGTVVSYG